MSQITWVLGPLEESRMFLTRSHLSSPKLTLNNIRKICNLNGISFKPLLAFIFIMLTKVLHDICLCTMCVLGAFGGQGRVSDPLELELQLVLSHNVSAKI